MKTILEKLKTLESEIAKDNRPFDLFALFSSEEEEEGEGAWDIVVSGLWINENRTKALEYIYGQVKEVLTEEEFAHINKFELLDVYDPRVKELQKHLNVEHGEEEINDYKFYGFVVDKIYVITCRVQVDNKDLLEVMWRIIVEFWASGKKKIYSEEILAKLKEQRIKPRDYSMDRVFEYLFSLRVVHGGGFINAEGVMEHGAMIITGVDTDWRPGSEGTKSTSTEKTWWVYHSPDGYTWNRVKGPYGDDEAKRVASEEDQAAKEDVSEGGLGRKILVVNYDQGIEAPLIMKGTEQEIIDGTR